MILFLDIAGAQELLRFENRSKHQLRIVNQSEFQLDVFADKAEPYELKSGEAVVIPVTSSLRSSPTVEAKYPKFVYEADKATLIQTLKGKLAYPEMYEEVQSMIAGKSESEKQGIFKQYGFNPEVLALFKKIETLDGYFAASQGTERNAFSKLFQPADIKDILAAGKTVTPRLGLEWGLPLSRPDLNDFWGTEASRITQEGMLSIMLTGDWKLGANSKTFLSLYAFIARERNAYGLVAGSNFSFEVDSTYLQGSQGSYTPLRSINRINLLFKSTTVGGYLRLLNYSGLYVDAGAGYYALQNIELEFDGGTRNDNPPVDYLGGGLLLREENVKEVASLDNRLFGLVRVGFVINQNKRLLGSTLGRVQGYSVNLGARLYPSRTVTATDNLHLYLIRDNVRELMPVGANQTDVSYQFWIQLGAFF